MKPRFANGNVSAQCPSDTCRGSLTTYEKIHGSNNFGSVTEDGQHYFGPTIYYRTVWRLMRCASCGGGGMAKIHCNGDESAGALELFYPLAVSSEVIPKSVPDSIQKEFREAEKCASIEAYRAAGAMIRSVLEKVLKSHGYNTGNLKEKIEAAVADGVLTASLGKRAHDNVRVLGNDVLHDEWRVVAAEEINESLHYAQRILEAFYDDVPSVTAILVGKNRISAAPAI